MIRIISICGSQKIPPVGRVICMKIARVNKYNFYIKLADFHSECLTETFNSKFTGRVKCLERQTHQTSYGTEVDNCTTPLFPHYRQHFSGKINHSKEIGIHLEFYVFKK